SHLAHPRRERHLDVRIRLRGIGARQNAYRKAACFLRTARGGLHHAAQPATQQHRALFGEEAADDHGPLRLLRAAPAAADHADEEPAHGRVPPAAAAQWRVASTARRHSPAQRRRAARARCARVVPRVRPTMVPRAFGSQYGAPSPTKAGTKYTPPVSGTWRARPSVSAA